MKIHVFRFDVNVLFETLNYEYDNTNRLPRDLTLKAKIRHFVKNNINKIEVVTNRELNESGYKISQDYYILYEEEDPRSQHFATVAFDDYYRRLTKDPDNSIFGDDFRGFRFKRSYIETSKNIDSLWTSSDLLIVDRKGNLIGNGISKGISNGENGARLLIEQLYLEGIRFFLFIDNEDKVEGGLGNVYAGTFGLEEGNFNILKSSKIRNDMVIESQFHHETWKKIQTLNKSKKISWNVLNWLVLKKVEENVLNNPKNGYDLTLLNYCHKYKFDLINNFGFKILKKGISKSDYDHWWINKVKESIICLYYSSS